MFLCFFALVLFRFGPYLEVSHCEKRLAHISCPQSSLCRTHIFPGCFLKRSIEQRGGGSYGIYLNSPRPSFHLFMKFLFVSSQLQQGFGSKKPGHFFWRQKLVVCQGPKFVWESFNVGVLLSTTTPTEELGSSISRNHLWNDVSRRWWLQEFPPRNAMKSLRWRKGAYLQHERAGDTPLFSLICSCLGGLAKGRCTRFQVFFARLIISIFSQYPEPLDSKEGDHMKFTTCSCSFDVLCWFS